MDFEYFPVLKVAPSEFTALHHLPNSDRDAFLPIIRLRPWRGAKKFESVLSKIDYAIGKDRSYIADVAELGSTDTECKAFISSLKSSSNGYSNWVDFCASQKRTIPVVQITRPVDSNFVKQLCSLRDLGRGVVITLRRESAWDMDALEAASQVDFAAAPVLVVFDYGQIEPRTDLLIASATITQLANSCLSKLKSSSVKFVVVSSSFPSNFAEINRETFRVPIQERQLFELVSASGISFRYGDYASVFAGERGFSRGGAPRIDLPKQTRWTYHRKETGGYQAAAIAVTHDRDWDPNLIIWGTERIKDASNGVLSGFTYAQAWTGVRIHLHLHQQANFGKSVEDINITDEIWVD